MTEPGAEPRDLPVDFGRMIESLRQAGADGFDPVQFHYVATLAERLQSQQGSVKRILQARVLQELRAFSVRFETAQRDAALASANRAQAHPAAAADSQRLCRDGDCTGECQVAAILNAGGPAQSLGGLARELASCRQESVESRSSGPFGPRSGLKSVHYFRETWGKLNAEKRVAQALGQAPKNAGPINSHAVVLRSLALMRGISPDYLNRFMSYVDTLLCLDQCDREMQSLAKTAADAGKGKSAASRRVRSR